MASGPKNAYVDRLIEAADRGRERGVPPKTVDLGECECPGKPHESDEAVVKGAFGWKEARAVIAANNRGEPGDGELALVMAGLLAWNLQTLDKNGQPVDLPITRDTIDRLTPRQGILLIRSLDEPHYLFGGALPNEAGEPSADGLAEERSA